MLISHSNMDFNNALVNTARGRYFAHIQNSAYAFDKIKFNILLPDPCQRISKPVTTLNPHYQHLGPIVTRNTAA